MKALGIAVVATILLACTQPARTGQPANDSLPSVASTAGALDNTVHAPGPVQPVANAVCNGDVEYCPSADQLRVDRSFSAIAMDSYLSASVERLVVADDRPCGPPDHDECEWRDANGVRHYPWGDDATDLRIVIKFVNADEFLGRPIGALGIGMARQQAEVVANVRRFLPNVEVNCDPQHVSGNVGPVECGASLNPGWFQIGFDRDGNLLRIRFDAYQFT